MIKPNKYLFTFVCLSFLLGTIVLIASQKFLPMLAQHTVYYCQSMLHSFSMKIPNSLGTFLVGLLLLLIGGAILKLFVAYIKVVSMRIKLQCRVQKNTRFTRVVEKLNLDNNAFLVEDEKPIAFCHGIRKPKIYISTSLFNMLNGRELEAILRHEKYHLENKDSFVLLLAEMARSLFPFFPLLSDLTHNYQIERELKADRQAIDGFCNTRLLLSVLKKLLICEPVKQYAFAPALADHETLEIRIKALMNRNRYFMKFGTLNILLSILSIGIFVALVIAPVQAIEMHDHENDVMMVCLQNDACTKWCKENGTVIPYSKAPNASYPDAPMTPAFSPVE